MLTPTPAKKKMKTSSCKAKGRKEQNAIVALLYKVFPLLREGDIRSCSMGSNGEDIILSPTARDLIPYSIEVKHLATGFSAIYKAYQQAASNANGSEPAVCFRQDRTASLTAVSTEHFFTLMKKAQLYDQYCKTHPDPDEPDR